MQSFDWRTLRTSSARSRTCRRSSCSATSRSSPTPRSTGSDDGTNLQPQDGEANTRWLAGLPGPTATRATRTRSARRRAAASRPWPSATRRTLLPVLEKPLTGAPQDQTTIFAFNLRSRAYTSDRWTYPYEPGGVSVADFQLADGHGGRDGIAIERDNSQGDLNGFKALEEIHLGAPGPRSASARRPISSTSPTRPASRSRPSPATSGSATRSRSRSTRSRTS